MSNPKTKAVQAYQMAEDLYQIFLLEAMTNPHLAQIVSKALECRDNASLFQASWTVGVTWAIISSSRVKEITDLYEQEVKRETTKN